MDSLISELSLKNTNNLRHLSLEEIPSHIGGRKQAKTVAPCQLHTELLSKINPVPPVSSIPKAPPTPPIGPESCCFTCESSSTFSKELVKAGMRHRPLTVRELDEWLSVSRPPKYSNLLDKIRKRTFQLEPTMYEDFQIL